MTRNIIKLFIWALFCSLSATGAWADGAVYAMTNALASQGGNQILVYHRSSDGTLTLVQTIATGGGGSGDQLAPPVDSLGSQGSLQLDPGHHRLFAVNTESLAANTQDCQVATITSFLVASDGTLTFADRAFSGGLYPDSLAIKRLKDPDDGTERGDDRTEPADLLYVLNAGGPGSLPCGTSPNITGFAVGRAGDMSPLAGAVRPIDPGPLNGTGAGENCPVGGFPVPAFNCGRNPPAFPRAPAQVRFTPDGKHLVVTVKGTNSIYIFAVGEDGRPGEPKITQALGPALPTYFGVTFDRNEHLIVTEAFGKSISIPAPFTGAVSSFSINQNRTLFPISASIGDGGTAACWIALEPTTGKYAFVSNNLSNSISSYSVGANGSLKLLTAVAAAGNGPNDLAVAVEGGASFLYVLNSGDGTVGVFQINLADGSLIPLPPAGGLPVDAAAQGIAAF